MALQIGDTIGTRYQIIEELGEGGFGKVFIAKDILKYNSECVVKQLQLYDGDSENGVKARELFQTEAKFLFDLEGYPQVPSLLAFLEHDSCIVQELISGNNLLEELEHGNFDEDQILDLLTQLLPILKEIHDRGIYHRDIKPENIIKSQEDNKLVLIDFGIAKQVSEPNKFTRNNKDSKIWESTNLGTPEYQAPDSFSSPASDLYSLGATCFHLLTGNPPPPSSYTRESSWADVEIIVKKGTLDILKKLLEEDPSCRYQNAEEVLQDLRKTEDMRRNEKIEFLLSLLNSENSQYRNRAINDLSEFGSYASAAVPQLINFLQEDDYQLHSSASHALAKIGEQSVLPLAKLLKDEKIEIRRKAARTLEEIGVKAQAAIPQFIQALEDSNSDEYVCWHAVVSIGKIGVPAKEAIPALIKRLKDSQPGIRAWALYALGRMGSLAKEAEPFILELLTQEEKTAQGNRVFIAGIESLDSIGVNIDEIQITLEDNNTITARKWVFLTREAALRSQKEEKEKAQARERITLEFRRPLNTHTPPLKDSSQFRQYITVEQYKI